MTSDSSGDTITAIATPPGIGGIGIIRISGAQSKTIAQRLTGRNLIPRHATLCQFSDENDVTIDEGIALFFPAPHSYSGEDMVEIHSHGSPVILRMLLLCILKLGARSASAGEFSRRALYNGKRDINQISAIADVINCASEKALRAAQRVLQGEFSKRAVELCEQTKTLRALLEASLDFPDEEIDIVRDENVIEAVDQLTERLQALKDSTREGLRLKDGIVIAIIGRPNAGKSSLLNCLAKRDVAIVNSAPGTTRDIVSCDILIDGIPATVIDTAGMRETHNSIEQEGVARAQKASKQADLVIVLVDATQQSSQPDETLIADLKSANQKHLVAYNKSDLIGQHPSEQLYLSAKTANGIEDLYRAIKAQIGMEEMGDNAMIVNARYANQIDSALDQLQRIQRKINTPPIARDMLAEDLRIVHQTLSEIIGEYPNEELLGDIFSRFCIGK